MKIELLNKFVFGILLLVPVVIIGQDVHFSQMRYSPLNLNPALAGAETNMQANVNYRNQWFSVTRPYSTIAASADVRFQEFKSGNGFLAAGINFYNDIAGESRLTTSRIDFSVAYHLILNNKSTIGLGVQPGFGQRGITPVLGTWSNQFVGDGFDTGISSGESFDQINFSHFDMAAGMVYHYSADETNMRSNDQREFTAGISAFHVNRPETPFLTGGENDLAVRWTAFAYGTIGKRNTNWSWVPAAYYMRQGTHQQLLLGSYARVLVRQASKRTIFFNSIYMSYGLFYRLQDALVAKLMLDFSSYSIGFAYDFNVSPLTSFSSGRGGSEIFIRYVLPKPVARSRSRIR